MLRGCCSCAISERPTPSLFVSPSLLRLLTPLFPLHPGNPPVTPLFPLLTQKQGGGGGCYPYGNVSTICRRADNFASRGPPPSYGGQAEASPYTNHQQRVTSHAGNVLNCKLSTEHPTRMLILSESGESKDHSSSESATLNCRLSLPRGWRKLSLSAILSCTHAVVRGSPPNTGTCL
jgi:hypothetical protein